MTSAADGRQGCQDLFSVDRTPWEEVSTESDGVGTAAGLAHTVGGHVPLSREVAAAWVPRLFGAETRTR